MKFTNVTRNGDVNTQTKARIWVFIYLSALLVLAGIVILVLSLIRNAYATIVGAGIIIASGILVIVLAAMPKESFVKKLIERNRLAQSRICTAVFTESGFEVTCYANRKNNGSFSYDVLAVTEYFEVWVLEYGEGRWVTLNKADMTEGTSEELSAFLQTTLGERYRKDIK